MKVDGLRILAAIGSRAERTRQRLLVAAVAVAGALLLATARIARIEELPRDGPGSGGPLPLAPFVAQPGLRVGVVLGGALIVVPVLVFAVQALRLGSTQRARRLAALRLAGAAPGELRRVGALQTGRAGLWGGLLAGPGYILLWATLGVLPTTGFRLLPSPVASDLAVWGLVVVLSTVGAMSAGAITAGPGGRSGARRPELAPRLALGLVALALIAVVLPLFTAALAAVPLALVVLGTPAARWVGRRLARRGDPVALLAAARLTADPGSAGRVAAVLAVCGFAFGVQGGIAAATVTSSEAWFYLAGVGLAGVATLVAVAVSVLALFVAAVDQIVSGRRSVAALSALGVEPSVQRRVLRRQLTAVSIPAAAVGALAGLLLLGPAAVAESGAAALVVLLLPVPIAAAAVAVLARLCTVPLRAVLADAAHPENLRVP